MVPGSVSVKYLVVIEVSAHSGRVQETRSRLFAVVRTATQIVRYWQICEIVFASENSFLQKQIPARLARLDLVKAIDEEKIENASRYFECK